MIGGRAALRALLFAAVLTLGTARPTFAQSPGPVRVALLAATPDDPLAGRIEAELRALGFQVERGAIPPDLPIDELVRQRIAGGVRAAVVADGHRTDVWIAAPGADRIGLRQELEVDEASGLQSVLALRTVEFLRISLGMLASLPPVAPLATSPEAPSRSSAGPGEPTWVALDVSTGVLASVGGVGPFAVAGASLRARLGRALGVEMCGYAPLNPSSATDAGNSARTTIWLAGGGLLLVPWMDRRVSAELGAGALVAVMRSTGAAVAPATSATDEAVGVALYGRAAGRLRLGRVWALRLDVLGGGALARPIVTFGSRDVASWGRAFVAGLGGGELRF